MRLVNGGAPGVSLAEHFTAMRDNPALAQPHNPSEAVATADLHAPMPPSRAHLKRLKRHAQDIPFYETPRNYPEPSPATVRLRAQLDTHKRDIQILGGSMTVKPPSPLAARKPIRRNYPIAGLLPYYPPAPVAAPKPKPVPVERLEPIRPLALRLWQTMATFHGPLTRKQQAEFAFICAVYGDVIYAPAPAPSIGGAFE